ncbi:MAG TPA: hypothetical protein VEK80_03470 [Kribbellaceae bacterium]|nr:hypothetical protein [Kribbellaceae bacterium]
MIDTESLAARLLAQGSACLMLAACTGAPGPVEHKQPTRSPATSATIGSADTPFVVPCQRAVLGQPSRTSDDLTVGPLTYPHARSLASMPPPDNARRADGVYVYKLGTIVSAGATVTVTVAPQARSYAALDHPDAPQGGDLAVTYQGCPDHDTGFVGGFLLKKQSRACVPLDVRIRGQDQVRRIVISFFNGTCPNPD